MKLTKKLLTSIIGISAIAGSTFAITSCGGHTNPWNSLQSFNSFTVLDDGNADDLMSVAKTHIPQAIESDPGTVFSSLDENVGQEVVYWSIAYAVAWHVKNESHVSTSVAGDPPGGGDSLDGCIGTYAEHYSLDYILLGGDYNTTLHGDPIAKSDSHMWVDSVDLGWAYILGVPN